MRGHHGEHRDLGGEGFGAGYADFRTDVQIHPRISFAGDGGSHRVDHAQTCGSLELHFPQGREGIRGFSRLADCNRQGAFINQRVSVAKFTRVLHIGGNAREPLEQIPSDQTRMPGRAATKEQHPPALGQLAFQTAKAIQDNRTIVPANAAAHRVSEGAWLLVDFLEHVMRVVAQLNLFQAHLERAEFLFDRPGIDRGRDDPIGPDLDDFIVVEVTDFGSVSHDRARIRGDVKLIFPPPHNQGAAPPSGDQGLRVVRTEHHQSKRPADFFQSLPDAFQKLAGLGIQVADQLREASESVSL